MKKYKATCYPSVESFDCGECEADSLEEAKDIFQDRSNANYGFLVLDEDIKEVEGETQ